MEKLLGIRGIPQFTLLIISLLLFGKVIHFEYNLDDEIVRPNFELSQDMEGLAKAFTSPYFNNPELISYGYRPITSVSFFLESLVHKPDPAISHAINLLLYIIIALLVYSLGTMLLKVRSWALILAILFIVHPLHVEVVSSIKNRDELLAMLFGLIAFFQLKRNSWISLFWCILLITLSLYSKKSGIGVFVAMPIISLWITQSSKFKYSILSLSIGILTFLIIPSEQLALRATAVSSILGGYYLAYRIKSIPKRSVLIELLINEVPLTIGLISIVYNVLNFNLLIAGISIIIVAIGYLKNSTDIGRLVLMLLVALISINAQNWYIILPIAALIFYRYTSGNIYLKYLIYLMLFALIGYQFIVQQSWFSLLIGMLYLPPFAFEKNRNKWYYWFNIFSISIALSINLYNHTKWTYIFTLLSLLVFNILLLKNRLKSVHLLAGVILCTLIINTDPSINQLNRQIVNIELIKYLSPQNSGRELHYIENPVFVKDSFIDKTKATLNTYGFYIVKFFIPAHLSAYYGYNTMNLFNISSSLIWLMIILGIIALFVFYKQWKLLFLFLLFGIALAPFSNLLVPVAGIVGDRLMFIPSLFLLLFITFLFQTFFTKKQWLSISFLALLTISWSVIAFHRTNVWRNKRTLFTNDITHQPNSVKLNELLADWYYLESNLPTDKKLTSAFKHYNQITRIYPEYDRAWFMLGQILQKENKPNEALKYYQNVNNTDYIGDKAYLIIADCAIQASNYAVADDFYKKAIKNRESSLDAYILLSKLYLNAGMTQLAISTLKAGLNDFPQDSSILSLLNEISNGIQKAQ